jgi:hypothetical protein
MSDSEQTSLDWGNARVEDRTLTVQLAGEADDEWAQTFARTAALLSGSWDSVAFEDGTVTVEDVAEGSEESLRFALDGAVQEANAHHARATAEAEAEQADEDDEDEPANEADQRMTDRFRDSAD